MRNHNALTATTALTLLASAASMILTPGRFTGLTLLATTLAWTAVLTHTRNTHQKENRHEHLSTCHPDNH